MTCLIPGFFHCLLYIIKCNPRSSIVFSGIRQYCLLTVYCISRSDSIQSRTGSNIPQYFSKLLFLAKCTAILISIWFRIPGRMPFFFPVGFPYGHTINIFKPLSPALATAHIVPIFPNSRVYKAGLYVKRAAQYPHRPRTKPNPVPASTAGI